nr:PREDICTED: probable tyrosyl-DNA phosphodiesterase [Bemisia tabaci]
MDSPNNKRNHNDSPTSSNSDLTQQGKRPKLNDCQYGEKCFRKNPQHFQEYAHPYLNDLIERFGDSKLPDNHPSKIRLSDLRAQIEIVKSLKRAKPKPKPKPKKDEPESSGASNSSSSNSVNLEEFIHPTWKLNRGKVKKKLADSKPYRLFFSAIKDSPETHSEPLSISFQELLDSSLGTIKETLQINFIVELPWLLAQYHITGNRGTPITILHGDDPDLKKGSKLPHVTAVYVKSPIPFGHHHTKMMIIAYTDGSIRVNVLTANLEETDWENRCQGVWIGPKCKKLPPGSDTTAGDSVTKFKKNLLQYLSFYKSSNLESWIDRVRKANFSKYRVFFTSSVPGSHIGPALETWGHLQIGKILRENPPVPFSEKTHQEWSVIAQCSSIGSLGKECNDWLCTELLSSFSRKVPSLYYPKLHVMYPSFKNVENSHDGLLGGRGLPYTNKVHKNQSWLDKRLYQWKSDSKFRSKAMPHIKTYCCVSPNHKFASWFLMTSANLSKAAFGSVTKKDGALMIRSYEAGVLFLPQYLIDSDVFPLEGSGINEENLILPLPYDLPLKKYSNNDSVWDYGIYSER